MGRTLLERLGFSCRHQFSWPRRTDAGDYYQVCVRCGDQYSYDWNTMRRTSRIEAELPRERSVIPKRLARKFAGRAQPVAVAKVRLKWPGWRPRERRLHFTAPVLYRIKGSHRWQEGWSENVSRSGLLFRAETQVAVGSALEIVLDMPEEITGFEGAKVQCQTTVARVVPIPGDHVTRVAVAIDDYQFLPEMQASGQ